MNLAYILFPVIFALSGYPPSSNCMNYRFYNLDNDAIEVEQAILPDKELSGLKLTPNTLQMKVIPNSYLEFPKGKIHEMNGVKSGFIVLLINNTSKELNLSNKDGKVRIIRQAFFRNEWRDLQSFDTTPKRICGNSFMSNKIIDPYSFITFIAPCIEGSIKTRFRFRVNLKSTYDPTPIYSNEFEGYIEEELIK